MMRYAVVIEKAVDNYSAYVPDLAGCIATGATLAEVERERNVSVGSVFQPPSTVVGRRAVAAQARFWEDPET